MPPVEPRERPSAEDIALIGQKPLRYWIACSLESYFSDLDGASVSELYDLVRKEMDTGLLQAVMKYARGNQSTASMWLGLARGTLRKKLIETGLEEE